MKEAVINFKALTSTYLVGMTRNEKREGCAMSSAVNDPSLAMRTVLTLRPVLWGSLF